MKEAEVRRFLETMDALQPRRDVYKHDEDTNVKYIESIRKAICAGIYKKTGIVAFVKSDCDVTSVTTINQVLTQYNGKYWDWSPGHKKAMNYFLIDEAKE